MYFGYFQSIWGERPGYSLPPFRTVRGLSAFMCLRSHRLIHVLFNFLSGRCRIGTLALLALLNYVGSVGQDIDFVRDITYWLSISGRAKEMVGGLISSEDVLYFLIIIAMFISFTMVKLQSGKVRKKAVIAGRYALISPLTPLS